jgi:hypothetical protein
VYATMYVDNHSIAMDDPEAFLKALRDKYSFKPAGFSLVASHRPLQVLGKEFTKYEQLSDTTPMQHGCPVHYPEPDTCDSDVDDVVKYQLFIGTLQWTISMSQAAIPTSLNSML